MSRMGSFTHAANIRELSARDVFTHVGNSPGELNRVQAETLQVWITGKMQPIF